MLTVTWEESHHLPNIITLIFGILSVKHLHGGQQARALLTAGCFLVRLIVCRKLDFGVIAPFAEQVHFPVHGGALSIPARQGPCTVRTEMASFIKKDVLHLHELCIFFVLS